LDLFFRNRPFLACDANATRDFAGMEREVETSYIGEDVMRELSQLDQVAYVRFASVYREFKDLKQFFDELNTIMQKEAKNTGE
jgi:transcriptional repressor NrdR